MGENKGPFYSYDPVYNNIELHKVCRECDHLDYGGNCFADPTCTHDVCPKLGDIRKGEKA